MLHALMQVLFCRRSAATAALLFASICSLHGYGSIGHEIVGAIAEERLANTSAGEQVNKLLYGISLRKAAVLADEIKGWDKKGADDPRVFHYTAHPEIDAQLRDFWRANQPTHDENSPNPSHHWFHYTDVPLVRTEKYADGTAGRSKWDVVHMIPYCVDVLRGRIPEQNDRKITKSIAVILIAHYVGDIHQPLHVGAQYFDNGGNVVDPGKEKSAIADEGGNTFSIELSDDPARGPGKRKKKFHGFWDVDTVNALLPEIPETLPKPQQNLLIESEERKLAHEMATQEPKNWKMPANLELDKYAEAWADEILPIAREAHDRIAFRHVAPLQQEDRVVATGEVEEKPDSVRGAYRKWATGVVREELQKAGWRLADLLTKALAATPAKASSPASGTGK
jgi:S1/P1 nuclease